MRRCWNSGRGCNDRLFTDADGERCLDYMDQMMLLAEDRHGNAQGWARDKLSEIEATINALLANRQSNEAANRPLSPASNIQPQRACANCKRSWLRQRAAA
jgi:hypothetical protein